MKRGIAKLHADVAALLGEDLFWEVRLSYLRDGGMFWVVAFTDENQSGLGGAMSEEKARIVAWLQSIGRNTEAIFVRAQVDGRWQSVPLSALPAAQVIAYLGMWLEQGRSLQPVQSFYEDDAPGSRKP